MAHQGRPARDPFHSIIDSLLKGIWWLITLPFKSRRPNAALEQAKAEFAGHWLEIENLASRQQWREAVMRADIVMDQALQWHRVSGDNLGERLKAASRQLSKPTLDAAWQAHKIRNRLAHELDYRLTPAESVAALANIKKVLRELGLQ